MHFYRKTRFNPVIVFILLLSLLLVVPTFCPAEVEDSQDEPSTETQVTQEPETSVASTSPKPMPVRSKPPVIASIQPEPSVAAALNEAESATEPSLPYIEPSPVPFAGENISEFSLGDFLLNLWFNTKTPVKIWFIFILVGWMAFLFKWRQLRKPLLFAGIITLGFYLGYEADPLKTGLGFVTGETKFDISVIVLIGLPLVLALLWGRFFCGWVCPLGGVFEFLAPERNHRLLPSPADHFFKNLKYVLLLLLLYFSWQTGNMYWNDYEPSALVFVFRVTLSSALVLTGLVLINFVAERAFCRYFCPYGALLSICSLMAPFRMRADAERCMVCGRCLGGICTMDAIHAANPEIDLPMIQKTECIRCLRCQKSCREGALKVSGFRIDHVETKREE